MGPKKKAADDGEDLSTEQFMKAYKANCKAIELKPCKQILEKYEAEYMEEGNPLQKVSNILHKPDIYSSISGRC